MGDQSDKRLCDRGPIAPESRDVLALRLQDGSDQIKGSIVLGLGDVSDGCAPVPQPTAALAPTLAPSEKRPDTRLLTDLRQWAPGKWRPSGGTNVLWIERDLRWSWESSFGGKWSGSGRGEIVDRRLILRGWHSTSIQMSLRLVREVETLVGEPQTNRSYPIAFVRE